MYYKEYYVGCQNIKTEEITEDEFNKVYSSVSRFILKRLIILIL